MRRHLSFLVLPALFISISPGQQLQLLTFDPIHVDGAGDTASTRLRLKNPDKQNSATCTLSLTDFKSSNTGKDMGVVATFYDRDTPGPPPASGRAVGPAVTVKAAAGEDFTVRLDLAHMIEAGESRANLLCDGLPSPIGTLVAQKQLGLPIKLTVNENPPEKPELAFVEGQPLSVQLKNDDPVTYPFAWEVFIKGRAISGTGVIGPNDVATIAIPPDPAWFSTYQSLFKDETVDGRMIVRYQPKGGQSADSFPGRSVPIKARLNYSSPSRRDLWATVVILLVLAFGGILSSYFNVDLVNRLRMVSIKKRLGELARQTGEIAPQLTSQLRVALLLEHKRIQADLPQGIFFTPETASVLAQCATDTDALATRVSLAADLSDVALRHGKAIDAGRIAASLADLVDRKLSGAQDLLTKATITPAEVQKVQSLVADAVNILDGLDSPDPSLEQILTDRLRDLLARFTDAMKQSPIFVEIQQAAPVPFALLTPGGAGGPQPERDEHSRKLLVVYDLMRMQRPASQDMKDSLRVQGLRALQNAELLLREAKDEVTPADLKAAIGANPPQLSIIIDRDVVRVNRACMMRLVFNNPRYNQAAAKRLIECAWHFGHNNLTERGWEVFHYFPQPQPYPVTVTFQDENHTEIPQGSPAKELDVDVKPPYPPGKSYWSIEIQRWLIGFLVAVLGLFAGAKDKIVTLDTLGAIFAVFLLGFTIDMAKNLVLPKQQ